MIRASLRSFAAWDSQNNEGMHWESRNLHIVHRQTKSEINGC
jgi:hypothetical protein